MPKYSQFLEHWYRALHAPLGYCFRVEEGTRTQAIQKLYAARKDAADMDLANLSIIQSPTSEVEVWIVKTKGQASGD